MTLSNDHSPFAPLPGTEPAHRGVFVDRWGTLLDLPETGTCVELAEATFVEGAVDALFRVQQGGWHVYLIGNEDQVAQGRVSDAAWQGFEEQLLAHLGGMGIDVRRNYACLDHPEGKGAHAKPSVFCLPD